MTLRSKSVLGLSSVQILFERGSDVMRARQMVGQFPRACLVEIPQAKLFVHEEWPAEVLGAMLELLRAA